MDKYEVKLENTSDGQKFHIYRNGNHWVEFGNKEDVEHLLTIMILSTSSGESLEIEDEVANSNLEIMFDVVTQKASLIEKDVTF